MKQQAFVLAIVISTLFAHKAQAIRYGTPVPESIHPAVGELFPGCAATLITNDTAITATHCLNGVLAAHTFTIHSRLVTLTQSVTLSDCYAGELSLIRFAQPIDDVAIPPIAPALPLPGDIAEAVGYGTTGTLPRSGGKKRGTVRIENVANLDLHDGCGAATMIRVMEADSSKQVPCSGDSGGPLLSAAGELLGILSFGTGAPEDKNFERREPLIDQCRATRFAYYVPLAPYAEWIQDALRELDASTP